MDVIVRQVVKQFEPAVRALSGNQVREIVPRDVQGRGATVRALLRELPSAALPLYLGDDTTDESAFAVLRGITVCVGGRQPTEAGFALQSLRGARRSLERLERELRKTRSRARGNAEPK